MKKKNQLSVKDRILLANTWSNMSVSEFLKSTSPFTGYKNLIFTEELKLPEPEKVLTEKQLFSKIKKELKEVKSLIN